MNPNFSRSRQDRSKPTPAATSPAITVTHTVHYEGCDIQFALVVFKTDSGERRELIVERADLHSPQKMKRELINRGFNPPPGKDGLVALIAKLTAIKPKKVRRILAKIGWYGRRFVLPDTTIPADGDEELAFQALDNSRVGNFGVKGTLEDWKNGVAVPALCSSRFMFAISLALAAPLLPFSGVEGGGVHIEGESSRGKTTTLLVAMSVSGDAVRGRLITWDITAAGLSEVAAAHNHTLLCIDEMGQASEADGKLAKRLQTTAFTLASGRGRIRSKAYNQSVGALDLEWNLLFLSTGEKALSDIATESAVARLKGEEVRFIDLPALAHPDFGVFERLPDGVSDPASLAESIEAACRQYHGTALREFLSKLAKNYDKVPDQVRERIAIFMKKAGIPDNGWEQRFAKRFALAYAAASMAISVNILPWTKEQAFEAINTCYKAARMRVPDTANILTGGLARLKERLAEAGRLPVYRQESPPLPSEMAAADGFRRHLAPHGKVYLLKSEPFSNWFDSSLQFDVVVHHLEDLGILIKGRDDCRTLQHQLKGIDSRARYYTLKHDPLKDL
jgi:putative DNA primase/helicase